MVAHKNEKPLMGSLNPSEVLLPSPLEGVHHNLLLKVRVRFLDYLADKFFEGAQDSLF